MITPLPIHPNIVKASRAFPLLSKEDEMELVTHAQAGDPKAIERLILSHLRMILSSARRFAPNADPNDLVQEGILGLMRAIKSFDPNKGVRFSTYARAWMRERQMQHTQDVRSSVKMGQSHTRRRASIHLSRTMETIEHKALHNGEHLTRRDILERAAQQLDITPDEAQEVLGRSAGDMSLHTPISHENDNESVNWIDTLQDEQTDMEHTLDHMRSHETMGTAISQALASLTLRERHIVFERHLRSNPPTLEVLGAQLNVSKERIRQIEARALEKMGKTLDSHRAMLLALMENT
jgi:RNA polymerase sigma-32 factor